MRCIHCGNTVKASDVACQHCGGRVVRPSVEASAGRRSSVGATFLLLLLGAGIAVWFARDRLPLTVATRDDTSEAPVTSPAQPSTPNPPPSPPSSPARPAPDAPASQQPPRSGAATDPSRAVPAKEAPQVPRGRSAPATTPTAAPASTKAVRVGGNIPAPQKIKDVTPAYPQMAVQARLQGVVIIEATIGTDGAVTNTRVMRPVHPLLDEAALEAVRQWEYAPTLLNGVAVPVIMTVTVNYSLK